VLPLICLLEPLAVLGTKAAFPVLARDLVDGDVGVATLGEKVLEGLDVVQIATIVKLWGVAAGGEAKGDAILSDHNFQPIKIVRVAVPA